MIKKKQVILAALVAMVGLAGYFNWSYQHSENGVVADGEDEALGEARLVSGVNITSEANYFENGRMDKETGRSKAMESLREVAENPGSTPESKKEAELKMVDMASRIEKETAAEAEIKAKGFEDALVYMNTDSVTVVVKRDGTLTEQEAVKIQEIIIRITGVAGDKIGISSHN